MSKTISEAKHFTYQILGDNWNVYLVSEGDDITMDGDADAETNLDSRELYFKASDLDTVIHEICHIYFRATYTRFTEIPVADMEEIAVALFADRGELMISQAKDIQRKLKELKK